MTRKLTLAAALLAAFSLPALAVDAVVETAPSAGQTATGPAFQSLFTETQARQHLMHLGYTNISPLQKDEDGRWLGSASKDGKTVAVAVDIKKPVAN